MKYYNIFGIGLGVLSIIKLNPFGPKFPKIKTAIYLSGTVCFSSLLIYNLKKSFGDIDTICKILDGVAVMIEQVIKFLPLIIYKDNFRKIINDSDKFWDCNLFPELIPEISSIYKLAFYALKSYRGIIFSTMVIIELQSLIWRNDLIIACWIPDINYVFELMLIPQTIFFTFTVLCVTSTDLLFLSFIVHISVQMKLLSHFMKKLDLHDKNFYMKIRECVSHREFLLRYLERVTKIYNIPLLGQYFRTIVLCCTELYAFANGFGGISVISVIRVIFTMLTMLTQMSVYCLPVSLLNDQIEDLSNSLYECKWHEGSIPRQKTILILLMSAQREHKILAAGLIEIGRNALITVFKSAFSFFTLMGQLKNK